MTPDLQALVFDVQGTLLDFYTPVHAALAAAIPDADHQALTLAWRRTYMTGTKAIAEGSRPYVPTVTIYREGLDAVLAEAGHAHTLSPQERDALTTAWTRLVPWPDTVPGLHALRSRLTLVTLTNGSMSATIAAAARHDLAFHAIVSTELVRSYKPAPETYRLALHCLGLEPDRVAMVASHPYDLEAAHAQGMRTIFIDRPQEFGPSPNESRPPAGTDLAISTLADL